MHEEVLKHNSGFVKKWLEDYGIHVLTWSALSPDLTGTEHL